MGLKIAILVLSLLFNAFGAWAEEEFLWTDSKELMENASQLDGSNVIYIGEAIGNIFPRGEFAWINVQDDHGTIGVWAPRRLVENIIYLGEYGKKGDTVEIEGKFFRSLPEAGGELCIRAERMRVLLPGQKILHGKAILKKNISLLLLGVCLFLFFLKIKFLKNKK